MVTVILIFAFCCRCSFHQYYQQLQVKRLAITLNSMSIWISFLTELTRQKKGFFFFFFFFLKKNIQKCGKFRCTTYVVIIWTFSQWWLIFYEVIILNLHRHVGMLTDQVPPDRQIAVDVPSSWYPLLHWNVTVTSVL